MAGGAPWRFSDFVTRLRRFACEVQPATGGGSHWKVKRRLPDGRWLGWSFPACDGGRYVKYVYVKQVPLRLGIDRRQWLNV